MGINNTASRSNPRGMHNARTNVEECNVHYVRYIGVHKRARTRGTLQETRGYTSTTEGITKHRISTMDDNSAAIQLAPSRICNNAKIKPKISRRCSTDSILSEAALILLRSSNFYPSIFFEKDFFNLSRFVVIYFEVTFRSSCTTNPIYIYSYYYTISITASFTKLYTRVYVVPVVKIIYIATYGIRVRYTC